MTKHFQRTIEDFTCAQCGAAVKGNGYTNHCPQCLYSRHVDINPGDRAQSCGGLMPPVGLDKKNDEWIIIQQCKKCGTQMRCKASPEDNVLKFAAELAHRNTR